jgi:hypothetical protein
MPRRGPEAKVARQDSKRSMSTYAALPCSLYKIKAHHRHSIFGSIMGEEKRARDIRNLDVKKIRFRPGSLSDGNGLLRRLLDPAPASGHHAYLIS